MKVEMKLNGTSEKKVKEILVHSFGNSISFLGSNGTTLTIASMQESVIERLKIIAGLTMISGEQGM